MRLAEDAGLLPKTCASFGLNDLWIVTKPPNSRLVRLEPNESQVFYLDDIAKSCPVFDWRNGRYDIEGLRLDVLKYRQWGCSTITVGLYLLDCMNHSHTHSRVLAHNPQTTADLLHIAHVMYNYLPENERPRLTYDNRGEMAFENGSSIRVLFVGSKGAGRGGTVKNVLESERAFWPSQANDIEFGLLQSIPTGGNIVRETTANGNNEFYEQYTEAEGGNTPYRALFYGWAPHKEYSLPVPPHFRPTEEETELSRLYGLDKGQLVWRREKIRESRRLDKHFEQEYPLNSSQAFISQGKNYYNNLYLQQLLNEMRSPVGQVEHAPLYSVERGDNGFHAGFDVWKEPEHRHFYILGADPGGGISKSGKQNHSSLHIFDLETWEEVLHYHGDPDPWDFGADIAALASWYNDAYCVVLRINHGHEVIRALQETGCAGIVTGDDDQFGLLENSRTKREFDDRLGTIINEMSRGEPGLKLHSWQTVRELISYSHLPGGNAGAEGQAFDDRQCSLKAVVWQFSRDDRRYNAVPKNPPAPQVYYGSKSYGRA